MTSASAARSLVLEKDFPAKTVLGRSVMLRGVRMRVCALMVPSKSPSSSRAVREQFQYIKGECHVHFSSGPAAMQPEVVLARVFRRAFAPSSASLLKPPLIRTS